MRKHYLLAVLFTPLSMLSVSLMLVSLWVVEPWRSLLINLSAGFIGSMITVFYVEKIIRRNEEHEWRKVMVHVGRQVNILANGTTSTVRLALGLDLEMPSSLDEQLAVSSDPRRMRQVMLALIENGLLPNLSGLTEMDQNAWKTFANNMLGSIRDAERILSLFSKNLDPTIMGLILDIHERARGLLLQYQIWPDMLGIPLAELKPNNRGESMIPYFRATYKIIIGEADQLLRICATLLREIDARFPQEKPL